MAGLLTKNKAICSLLLRLAGLPVPEELLLHELTDKALRFLEEHQMVVLKPNDTNHGVGISMDIRSVQELQAAYQLSLTYSSDL